MLTKNKLGKDPVREEQLNRRAALMIAEGKKPDKEIARELNMSMATLQTLKKSPLFQQLVSTYGDEIDERGLTSIIDDLREDAPRNLDFVKRVRDGSVEADKKMPYRMQAAKMLLDKQAPSADAITQAQAAGKVIINARLLGQMLRSLKNVGAIDIEAEEIDAAVATNAVPRIPARTPEEFADRLTAEALIDKDEED